MPGDRSSSGQASGSAGNKTLEQIKLIEKRIEENKKLGESMGKEVETMKAHLRDLKERYQKTRSFKTFSELPVEKQEQINKDVESRLKGDGGDI